MMSGGRYIDLALEETQLSPRELAVRFTDTRGYFVSEASVCRLLKAHDLITSPAFGLRSGGFGPSRCSPTSSRGR